MRFPRSSLVLASLLALGCSLDRTAILPAGSDGSVPPDTGTPRADAQVSMPDAGTGRDAQVSMPDTGPGCVPSTEICDGIDNDCDASTVDGAQDPMLGAACDGPDSDMCANGTMVCDAGSLGCMEAGPAHTEMCDGMDDDCNGHIDDGAGCPCRFREHGSHAYLFCGSGGDRSSWTQARDFCVMHGYALVTIDDADEQMWLQRRADSDHSGNWWIGATDRDDYSTEGTFVWAADGSALGYTNWLADQPDNFFGAEDCAELRSDAGAPDGTPGGWNDTSCDDSERFICESGS